ncbi:MAG: hypothetical protein IM584_04135 [Chitinophagaceae bacterium]|nr:hypothetical protein [Chitinophagaceae bacterium]MCA6453781.1 hypothetical protein [Chitinophagaceae bacterium]MCA6455304.1 hypothetical protein [Chitinophagaceae bacterium]MCA6460113.1 hypothetical protein [Chitinophagaceae bacterium]MCA6464063.1 hypothetical protein [Chitinophagaceae bacterium]
MQVNRIALFVFFTGFLFPAMLNAQVNSVEFGKNRVQHKKFIWKFYQSPNFNTYVAQGGVELGKFVAQVAEEELRPIENFIEYSLQRRANIVVYNSYNDFKSSNIGLGSDWQNSGGLTKLVNNKLVVYFDGNHEHLKRQIREGIARVLTDNLLFGDDIGEFASNQALLDLPKWLVDGYVSYAAEPWSTAKDDELKSAILGGRYNSFYQFAFEKPVLAGHAFWYYIGEKYRKENITYLLYLARIYKNLNNACLRVCKRKFKEVLSDFMQYQQELYAKDIRQRRNQPKGQLNVSEDVSKNDYFRFQANPNPKSSTYGVVEFKKGQYRVKLMENFYDARTLLSIGVRTNQGDINPNYPILAWDGKGTRLLVVYWESGKVKMFVYDIIAKIKRYKQEITGFDQVLDASFMLDANTLVMSAVKNGHSDIYTYKIDADKATQITNDVYDDLDPSFVSFPNRSGIIYASNRPSPDAPNQDTVLPSKYPFNIYMVDILNDSKQKQLAKLTDVKMGNARYPMQYNTNHFTFVSDENGIGNRWAGFFATQRNGLDTLYYIGDELLRNPSPKEFDSTLVAWQKQEPDSVSYFQVYKDSTYTFPITNYQSTLLETRIAGNNGLVSEVRREGDFKFLYKLKVDEQALAKRNVNARPTEYVRKLTAEKKASEGKAIIYNKKAAADTTKKVKDFFQNEFADEKPDSTSYALQNQLLAAQPKTSVLSRSRLFDYRLKFSSDYALVGFTNNILINRYQPYGGGSGPIRLNNGNDFNFTFRVGASDLMEDQKFVGGIRFGTNLSDKDVFFSYQNLRRRFDWGLTYYRSNVSNFYSTSFNTMLYTNLYQFNISYPFNEVKSFRATVGLRSDRGVLRSYNNNSGYPDPNALKFNDTVTRYIVSRFEYVHDNTINPTQNIWNGLRYKIYFDVNMPTFKTAMNNGKSTLNLGFDARYYHKIYRNFIWAGRAAGDFSWGGQKILYYLGGVDGWISPKFNNNQPAADQTYAFQSLTLNMRGYNQNIANGNNAVVINSEFRFPVFSTLLNRPINNAFLRNFQLVQFLDLGTAWNGKYNGIKRPGEVITAPNTPILVRIDAGGLGPFAGGYGFGIRSTALGYFVKLDAGWPMKGLFLGKPVWYFSLGFDF